MHGKFLKVVAVALLAAGTLTSPVSAEWWEARTAHFRIYSQDSEKETREFAEMLERFDNALRTMQNIPIDAEVGDANRVTVYRFGDARDIAYLAGSPASGIAGFYVDRAGEPAAFTPVRTKRTKGMVKTTHDSGRYELDPISVLKHEYTHAFMLQNFPATYPDWYIEGFAEIYATIDLKDDGSFHVGDPPQYRASDMAQLGLASIDRLLDHSVKLRSVEYYQFYSTGFLLAHYLNFSPERTGQLSRYLKALAEGRPSLDAAKEAFGDLDKLQSELRKYQRGNLFGYDIAPGNYKLPEVKMRALSAAEENLMREHMRLRVGVNKKDAIDVAHDAESKAAAYPDSLFVQLTVAEAQFDAQNFDRADAAANRALAIDPQSVVALLFKGRSLVGRGDTDPASFASARAYFIKAAKLDRRDPRPLIDYYLSFRKEKTAIPEDALMGLEQAFPFAAFDKNYRMILARQLLDERKGKIAKSVLAPIAYSAHQTDKENKVATIVNLIDADKVDEAQTAMEALFRERDEKQQTN